MAFKADVYLQRAGDTKGRHIGIQELEQKPVRNGKIIVPHNGKPDGHPVIARVEMVAPDDWEAKGTIPVVHAIESDSA